MLVSALAAWKVWLFANGGVLTANRTLDLSKAALYDEP